MPNQSVLPNYLIGKWIDSESGEKLQVRNHANGKLISYAPLSSRNTIDSVNESARKASHEWKRTRVTKRIQHHFKFKELLEDNRDQIAKTITDERGKTIHESRGQLRRAIENVDVALYQLNRLRSY